MQIAISAEKLFHNLSRKIVSQPVRGKGIELHAKALGLAAVHGHRRITHAYTLF
jgi:hypothetical protein